MTEKIKLKPCPFCGCDDIIDCDPIDINEWKPVVGCTDCGAMVYGEPLCCENSAIDNWNTRHKITEQDYYMLSYSYRRRGESDFNYFNEVIHGNIVDWVVKTSNYYDEKYILLNFFPITKEDYERLYDIVN